MGMHQIKFNFGIMTNEKLSTAIGMVTGVTAKIMMQDMAIAILTAFATGGAAYLGQIFFKFIHQTIKKKLNEKNSKEITKQNTRFF